MEVETEQTRDTEWGNRPGETSDKASDFDLNEHVGDTAIIIHT